MARSTMIYVVYRGMKIFGAFTVRHEMACKISMEGLTPDDVMVMAYRDGQPDVKPVKNIKWVEDWEYYEKRYAPMREQKLDDLE